MSGSRRVFPATAVVLASMVVLFAVPSDYFVPATFFATSCMILAALYLGSLRGHFTPSVRSLALGALSAVVLYLIFVAGGAFVDAYHPFGVTSASESSIYSLISSTSNPRYLQVLVLFFDSAGYETFFRGVLQARLTPRLGAWAAPAVALVDASMHIFTLNPIWIGGTFLTDLAWGLTYRYGRGTQSSFTSHFLWDVAIFILRPVT